MFQLTQLDIPKLISLGFEVITTSPFNAVRQNGFNDPFSIFIDENLIISFDTLCDNSHLLKVYIQDLFNENLVEEINGKN